KAGPLARLNQVVLREQNRLENGGPGDGTQKLIQPQGNAQPSLAAPAGGAGVPAGGAGQGEGATVRERDADDRVRVQPLAVDEPDAP
ncbi:MAG: hypothetical protein FJ086_09630, partial [Deltaproteobacteria bacterium]|nr:hypothetical protein [Deltaproteobacteria bacterium]